MLRVFQDMGYLVVRRATCGTDRHVAHVDVQHCPCPLWDRACPVQRAPIRPGSVLATRESDVSEHTSA